jgi:drug/metabolite transporter (DMT)-like permease
VASQHGSDEAAKARHMLILLALVWGVSWPIMKIALDEVGVFGMRAFGFSISAVSLFGLIYLQGRSAALPLGVARLHVVVAGLFNVIGFGLFSSFAMLDAATSRVVIINYSMPVWASLMAWPILGERINLRVGIGLALCVAGLAVLVYPVALAQSVLGLVLALGCALSWAAGTIYMKWARMTGNLLTITAWQIALGAVVFCVGLPLFQTPPLPAHVSLQAALAVLYNGLIGTGLAYILWFAIIERLSTATASLGTLATPVIGVGSSMLVLGERLTMADTVGFALISAAAACVLVQPRARAAAQSP